jgi:hypothetical protein
VGVFLRFFLMGGLVLSTVSGEEEEEEEVGAGGGVTTDGRSYESVFGDVDSTLPGVGAFGEDSSVVIRSDDLVRRREETGVPVDKTLSGEITTEAPVTAFRRVEMGISPKSLLLRLRVVVQKKVSATENGEPERKVACTKTGLQGIRVYRNILQRLRLVRKDVRCIPETIATL